MSRKIYILLSLVLIVSFALAACGTPATEAPVAEAPAAATEAPAAEAPAATEAPAEKVTVTWWHITTKDPGLSDLAEDGR